MAAGGVHSNVVGLVSLGWVAYAARPKLTKKNTQQLFSAPLLESD
jgi:hypothetical protein